MSTVVDYIKDALNVLNIWRQELILTLRVPTPLKVVKVVTTLGDGCIGSGIDDPSDPETLYECTMANEAWIHRVNVTSPSYGPSNPLATGQIMLIGSGGEIISWSPQPGLENNVLPANMEKEGRFSAAHLSPGERLCVVGDQLPPGIKVRFDVQLNLVAGVSGSTPIPFVGTSLASSSTNGD